MRTALLVMAALIPVGGAMAAGAGCGVLPDDCRELFTCAPGNTGGNGGGGGAGGAGGAGGGPQPGCVPSASNKDPIADTCGIFVSSSLGADMPGAGTKDKPFKTLGAALAEAAMSKMSVYACAEKYTESISVAAPVSIFGGLDCAKAWVYSGTKATLTTGADAVPLLVQPSASGSGLADFTVQAVSATKDGGSSIAAIVDGATMKFTRCDLIAGDGKPGVSGETPTDNVGPSDPMDPEIKGNNGIDACTSSSQQLGGDSKENMYCPGLTGGPIGGAGGNGAVLSGSDGSASMANAQTALGGKGQSSADPMWGCGVGGGQDGNNGLVGDDGAGAIGESGLGKVDASGYVGIPGKDGGDGKPGQGGGGGGGAKGKMSCAGASGGGGGAGGCGGKGGKGGMAGGVSIGLVSLDAMMSFVDVKIQVGIGGAGGDGSDGEAGGAGGDGGKGGVGSMVAPGTAPGCKGGQGGTGGFGGKGGGGRGGHAIGIAATGSAMPETKGVSFTKGMPGMGGKGGMMQDGDPGVQADVQVFQ